MFISGDVLYIVHRTPNDLYFSLTGGKVVNICAMLTLICLINLSAVCVVYCVAPLVPLQDVCIYSGYHKIIHVHRQDTQRALV